MTIGSDAPNLVSNALRHALDPTGSGPQRYVIEVRLQLVASGQTLKCSISCYGHNIQCFCNELDRLRETLTGSARLCDWDDNETLCFTAVNQRGIIVLGGHMSYLASADAVSETNYLKGSAQDTEKYLGVRSDFDGFLLDQSDLERPVAATRKFRSGYDIITENPDLPAFDRSRIHS